MFLHDVLQQLENTIIKTEGRVEGLEGTPFYTRKSQYRRRSEKKNNTQRKKHFTVQSVTRQRSYFDETDVVAEEELRKIHDRHILRREILLRHDRVSHLP